MKRTLVLARALLLLSSAASAQWIGGVQIGTLVDDNAFNNSLQIPDRMTELTLRGGYNWEMETSNTRLLYTGTLNYFSLLPERTFQLHNADLSYSRGFGEDEETSLSGGGTVTLRNNREEFSVYDHVQISLYGMIRANLTREILLKVGYAFSSVAFAELNDFNYLEHALFVQAAGSLPTRTTLILRADLGFKNYTTPNVEMTRGSAWGSGRGRRSAVVSTPGVTQLAGMLRIGQGITEKTGLSLTGEYQLSLRKESRYLTFDNGVLTDDEVFDDHYGYEGPIGSLVFTQILPAEFTFRASGSIQERRYSNRAAYDLLDVQVAPQRLDTRSTTSLSIEKAFLSLGMHASLAYDHIINASNDALYRYHNDALSIRISFTY